MGGMAHRVLLRGTPSVEALNQRCKLGVLKPDPSHQNRKLVVHLWNQRFHIKNPNCLLPREKIRYGDTGPVFKPAWLWSAGADLLLHPAAGVWTLQVTVVPIPLCCLINVSYLAPSNIWICHCCFKWRKGNLILGPKRLGRALCMTFLQFRSHLITSKYTPRDTSCLWSSWASFPTRLWAPWGKGSQLPFHCYIPSALHSA